MTVKRSIGVFVLTAMAAVTAAETRAGVLARYKDWGNSPEAYFLSAEERQRWSAIDSDEAAETFIAEYRAVRGKGFGAAIQSRIAYADKNFSIGKKKGSETLRGRTLIVFGPPTRVVQGSVSPGAASKTDPLSGDLTSAGGGGERGSGGASNAYSNAGGAGPDSLRAMRPVTKTSTSTWIYDEKTVPPALKTKELTLEFTVEPDTGKEDAKDRAKLDEMLNAAVEYWKPKKG